MAPFGFLDDGVQSPYGETIIDEYGIDIEFNRIAFIFFGD